MLDIKFIRENPEIVKENIKKKFQNAKLPLVDEVIELDAKNRAAINEAQELRSQRNTLSKQVGMLMGQAKKDPSKLEEAEAVKAQVKANADRLAELEVLEAVRQFSDIPLVLHGCTGMEESIIKDAIKLGVAKINFGTEVRYKYVQHYEEALKTLNHQGHSWKLSQFACDALSEDIKKLATTYDVGDAVKSGRIANATHTAYRTAMALK